MGKLSQMAKDSREWRLRDRSKSLEFMQFLKSIERALAAQKEMEARNG